MNVSVMSFHKVLARYVSDALTMKVTTAYSLLKLNRNISIAIIYWVIE